MNIFMCNPEERMGHWASMRDQLVSMNKADAHKSIIQFWNQAPFSKNVIHPRDSSNWPTVWEMLCDGEFCHNSISYCVAMTIILSEMPFEKVQLVMSECAGSFAVVVDSDVLCCEYGEVIQYADFINAHQITYSYTYDIAQRGFKLDRTLEK